MKVVFSEQIATIKEIIQQTQIAKQAVTNEEEANNKEIDEVKRHLNADYAIKELKI